MEALHGWKARRAGGRITINATESSMSRGEPRKVVGVDVIEVIDGKVIATDRTGAKFALVVT